MQQGNSSITLRKEFEIGGLATMRLRQFSSNKLKFYDIRKILIADVFSGDGFNILEGGQEVDGSPVRLMKAFKEATSKRSDASRRLLTLETGFYFSDIRKKAIEHCKQSIAGEIVSGQPQPVLEVKPAADAIAKLGNILENNPDLILILVLDPNGPKAFPRNEVIDLLRLYSRRVDVIPNISATAVRRCLAARDQGGIEFDWWLSVIENLDDGFIRAISWQRNGWIRQPDPHDRWHWFMVPTFGIMRPRHDWSKQGYVDLNSSEGYEAVKFYSGKGQDNAA